jgi:hypothetical protein
MDQGAITDNSGSLLMGIAGGMAADYAIGRIAGAIFGRGAGEVAGGGVGRAASVDVTNLSAKIVKQMGPADGRLKKSPKRWRTGLLTR